jgi:DNA-binding transcriptional LysR family regulator
MSGSFCRFLPAEIAPVHCKDNRYNRVFAIAEIRIMIRGRIIELEAIVAVAKRRSFRAAASELGLSATALSQAVAELEARLGVRLFNRTTRSVSPTAAGEQFAAEIEPALAAIRNGIEGVNRHRASPIGVLRLNVSAGGARQILAPIVFEFMRRHPETSVDIVTNDRFVDIVKDGFDAGIRLAEHLPGDMIAVPLGPDQRLVVVGSPKYFKVREQPQHPNDLETHECIRRRLANGSIYRWEFERRGRKVEIDVPGRISLDDTVLMQEAAVAGLGLAYISAWQAAADIRAGRLVQTLDEWTPSFPGLCLYYPGRRHVPSGLRALIELIRELKTKSPSS